MQNFALNQTALNQPFKPILQPYIHLLQGCNLIKIIKKKDTFASSFQRNNQTIYKLQNIENYGSNNQKQSL